MKTSGSGHYDGRVECNPIRRHTRESLGAILTRTLIVSVRYDLLSSPTAHEPLSTVDKSSPVSDLASLETLRMRRGQVIGRALGHRSPRVELRFENEGHCAFFDQLCRVQQKDVFMRQSACRHPSYVGTPPPEWGLDMIVLGQPLSPITR